MELILEQLVAQLHDRNSFDCGVPALNVFLKQHANQNQAKNLSKTYVAVPAPQKAEIYGYYTLSAGQIYLEELPDAAKLKLPKYPIPIARLARLAVAQSFQGRGIGGFLLYDALSRVLSIADKLGIFAVVVDAKDESAKKFYQQYGFTALQTTTLTLYLPISTIKSINSNAPAAVSPYYQ